MTQIIILMISNVMGVCRVPEFSLPHRLLSNIYPSQLLLIQSNPTLNCEGERDELHVVVDQQQLIKSFEADKTNRRKLL